MRVQAQILLLNMRPLQTTVKTTKGGTSYPIGSTPVAGMNTDNFVVNVSPKTAISGTQRAGTYKDTLFIKVTY